VPTPAGDVPVTVTRRGQGRPVLLLHGGAGPDSVAGFAGLLADRFPVQVLVPVHPGFGGTPRPAGRGSARKLGELYRDLLGQLGLTDVTVLGSSIGGWIAAELALAAPDRVGRLVLLDAAGLVSAGHPAADYFSMTQEYAAAIPGATFRLVPDAGHLPQLEAPEAVLALLAETLP
jgi:pimeloyl-ACP methyl ester carboxylesterase